MTGHPWRPNTTAGWIAVAMAAILAVIGVAWSSYHTFLVNDVVAATFVRAPTSTPPDPETLTGRPSPSGPSIVVTPSAIPDNQVDSTPTPSPSDPTPTPHDQVDPTAASLQPDQAHVRIPEIGVDTIAQPVGLQNDGAMETPSFGESGWYDEGPMPTAVGPAVVVAHVDGPNGPDVFARLDELQSGDEVIVTTHARTQRYVVTRSERHPKDRLPAADIWDETQDRALRLITCGGTFDTARRSYRDNVIVWATPEDDV